MIQIQFLFIVQVNYSKNFKFLNFFKDGWDRTSAVSAISQILLDPYYRTIEGFSVLIEKEWISFGFKFQERNDHLNTKSNEKSPIFYQFIHCILLIWMQFPNSFEFNQKFLFFILEQSYSCLFGNFLYNNELESKKIKKETFSIWNFINLFPNEFLNLNYKKNEKLLKPTSENISNHFFFICESQYRDHHQVEKFDEKKSIEMIQIDIEKKKLNIKENEYLKRFLKEYKEKRKSFKEENLDLIFQKEILIQIEDEGEDPIYKEIEKYSMIPELPLSLFGATSTALGFAIGGPIGASLGFGLTYLVGNAFKNEVQVQQEENDDVKK